MTGERERYAACDGLMIAPGTMREEDVEAAGTSGLYRFVEQPANGWSGDRAPPSYPGSLF